MRKKSIERISSGNATSVAEFFGSSPARPVIVVDGVSSWPASRKWNLDFFASNFGADFGTALSEFDSSAGKATKLGTFIDNLEKPLAAVPGLWVTEDGKPARSAPEYDEKYLWAFNWDPFRRHPELYADIAPFPPQIPNIIARLDPRSLETLQKILRVDLYSIYITRANTITPLHRDFNHTIGSLVQFQSSKTVFLFAPDDYESGDGRAFDPEVPDYARYPAMKDVAAYADEILPGEMLIIPPDWWHYTRNQEHSVTLSHNFINHLNVSSFMACVSQALRNDPENRSRFETVRRSIEQAGETGTEGGGVRH